MKIFGSILALSLFALTIAPEAHALPDSAKGVVYEDSSGAISVSAYTTVVASLTKAVKGVMISNTAASALILAIGPAASEQDQLIIPGGGASAQPVFYPIALSQGLRISLKARDSAAAIGQQILNFFYY